MSNTFGTLFRLTTFGESHGTGIGGVIDGMPAGISVDTEYIRQQLARRRPGQSDLTTSRKEADEVELLSGIYEGKTTGTPIGFIVRNGDQHSSDYEELRTLLRPSHADYAYSVKYGVRDHRGGGRSSARETVSRVVAGAFAQLALREKGIAITAYTAQVGSIELAGGYADYDLSCIEANPVRCPDAKVADEMEQLIRDVKQAGDTIGGRIDCVITGCPVGLGEPVADKLHARLGAAMLSINAAKGFWIGDVCRNIDKRGSELNDILVPNAEGRLDPMERAFGKHLTNHSGGVQGGISNGEDIYFSVMFKPVPTLLQSQKTIDINGNEAVLKMRGRHDPCVLPRAVPIVESMAAIVILDSWCCARALSLGSY